MRFPVLIKHEELGYVATEISSGVASQGDTVEEALEMLEEALELFYEDQQPGGKEGATMSNKEMAHQLIEAIPEKRMMYVIGLLQGAAAPDDRERVEPVHDPDCECPLCRIYRYPNEETLAAFEEAEEMRNSGSGQHFKGTAADFTAMLLAEE